MPCAFLADLFPEHSSVEEQLPDQRTEVVEPDHAGILTVVAGEAILQGRQ